MYTAGYAEPVPRLVSTMTAGWSLLSEAVAGSAPASAGFEAANVGIWYPVFVPTVCVARRMWWANGASRSSSYYIEAGIYLDGGHKPGAKLITTGSVSQGTANSLQFADITDTTLCPGLYWLFISCSTNVADIFRSLITSTTWSELIRFQQASIGPGSAPATATPAEANYESICVVGFATTASP